MSVSQLKSFIQAYDGCESAAVATLAGDYERPQKDAFIEGKYIHAWSEGYEALADFKADNPEIYAGSGKNKGQLKSTFQHCNTMIEVLENDPMVMKALDGQKEVIMTAELFGIKWKVMLDSYKPEAGFFADLKAMKAMYDKFWSVENQVYENFIDHYGYNVQMAVYAEIEKRATGRENWLLPHIVAVTKEKPPDHEIILFDYEAIQQGLNIVERNIERVKLVKSGQVEPERCGRCAYCRETKQITKIKHYSEFNLY